MILSTGTKNQTSQQKTLLWFRTPNPMLGNATPRIMIRMGRFKKLLTFIQTALEESKTV